MEDLLQPWHLIVLFAVFSMIVVPLKVLVHLQKSQLFAMAFAALYRPARRLGSQLRPSSRRWAIFRKLLRRAVPLPRTSISNCQRP